MKIIRHVLLLTGLLISGPIFQGCNRSSDDMWDDTKTAGRHIQRGLSSLTGQRGASRQIQCRGDFESIEDGDPYSTGNFSDYNCPEGFSPYPEQEFVPLQDCGNELAMNDLSPRPPRCTPGEFGSSLPGIEAFRDPSTVPGLCRIFQPVYFEYNCYLIRGNTNVQTVREIAEYMRYHPNVYVYIEGHTDEKGPHEYNLALGSRRANAVRNFLIGEGVNPDNLFPISYGKERPAVLESHEEGWAKNRRAEFKVYER